MDDIFLQGPFGRVHCRATGEGRLLFLMHSAGRSAHEFDALAQRLAGRFRVLSWDMPGHGDSDRPQGHVTLPQFADLAVELACSLGERPILGGGSVGAAIALAATGSPRAAELGGIVSIELPLTRDGTWWARNWGMIETMFGCPEEPEERARARFRTWTPELAARLAIDRHKAGGHAMMDLLWAGRDDADRVQPRIRALAVPALFVNGDGGVAPEAATLLPSLNPAAVLRLVADSGHFPHSDDPEAVARAIQEMFA
ncbi:alpha/beta fold hydrolase [Sphingomonas sp. C8-2]|jgi:pimeloyl-ACP methyl ester carboxylesterase|nr:alpha/beta fold hydrolase [Sphingomonas sp. C8-2]